MKFGIIHIIFFILFTLKCMGYIDISWWIVCSPLILWLIVLIICAVMVSIRPARE